jgi:hypothetical protein
MLLRNARITQKNYIVFQHNNQDYYQPINDDTKINIFNQPLINIYLEQFEETIGKVTYNDITHISILENHSRVINGLPCRLKSLIVISSMAGELVLSNEVKETIELIHIDKSNISKFPDISNCHKLKVLKLNHSEITKFNITYDLPNSLLELNLQNNLITNNNFSYGQLLNAVKKTKFNFSDNCLNYDAFPNELAYKCNLVRQFTYKHNKIKLANVGDENIRYFINQHCNNADDNANNLFGNQNVHLSSINQSILSSIDKMKDYVNTHNVPMLKIPKDSYSWISCLWHNEEMLIYKHLLKNKNLTKSLECSTLNSFTNMTFSQTFELISSILDFKCKKGQINLMDAIERMETEINDSIGLCFTGQYNRLINSMVGIIEGVHVGFSSNEELQLEFGKIIEKFNKNISTFEELCCHAKNILINTNEHVQYTWMSAINDLKPDDTSFNYNNKTYLKTHDEFILDCLTKDVLGYSSDNNVIVFFDS